MEKIPELLSGLTTPEDFTRERLSRDRYESLSLEEPEKENIEKIIVILEHEELHRLVMEGKVTLAMIKPRADWNTGSLSDLEACKAIEEDIKEPLESVFSVSILFNKGDIDLFYAEPKLVQLPRPPIIRTEFANRWEEFVDIMLSGPTTFLLLYSKDANAISEWRRQIGHWDVDNRREQGTIRGKWAKDNYTSIVHGSDKPEAVLREISFLKGHLQKLI